MIWRLAQVGRLASYLHHPGPHFFKAVVVVVELGLGLDCGVVRRWRLAALWVEQA